MTTLDEQVPRPATVLRYDQQLLRPLFACSSGALPPYGEAYYVVRGDGGIKRTGCAWDAASRCAIVALTRGSALARLRRDGSAHRSYRSEMHVPRW